jgi:hypothetical protein
MDPSIVLRDDRVCGATWGAVFFEIWYGHGTAGHFRALGSEQVRFARSLPGQKMALFTIVLMSSIPQLDREVRQAIEDRSNAMMPHTLAAVVVLPTQGFGASIVRSVIAATSLLRRSHYPSKVCPTVDEGCR